MAADVQQVHTHGLNGGSAEAGPSRVCLAPLPYSIDPSCPIALPSRQHSGSRWPFGVAGPSHLEQEEPKAYVKRRYLETLFLSDVLSPISHLVQDVLRIEGGSGGESLVEALQPHLLVLSQIEQRHRKVLQPIISGLTSASTETASAVAEETLQASSLSDEEKGVLRVALELRRDSRKVADGGVVQTKKLCEELERRETLLQVALLFVYVRFAPPTQVKKRKREKKKSTAPSALDDPPSSLEILVDRLSVWSAVADLGIGTEDPKERVDNVQTMLKGFWTDVVVPFFLPHQPALCAAFHLKVFARPISPRLAPAQPKKSRKPTLTRSRPSTDTLTQRPEPPRAGSKAPSEGSRASSPRQRSLSRSLSARPDIRDGSQSVDPAPDSELAQLSQPKKGLMRAPSGGRDLFKGRQVGLMRRTSSVIAKKTRVESQSSLSFGRSESQIKMGGLLGRKTSDPGKNRRNSAENQFQSQSQTLIFATPSKPKTANSIFGQRLSQYVAPTPIREEPSSAERELASFVTETPVAHGRIARGIPGSAGIADSVTETPEYATPRIPSSGRSYAGMAINALSSSRRDHVPGSDDESELGDLMVMTDDEDDGVPDTPAR